MTPSLLAARSFSPLTVRAGIKNRYSMCCICNLQFDSHGARKIFAVSEGDDFLVPCLKETKAILPQRGAKKLDTDIAYSVVKKYLL